MTVDISGLLTGCASYTDSCDSTGSRVNMCESCMFMYNALTQQVDATNCAFKYATVEDKTCFAGLSENACYICMPGYELYQGVCYKLLVPTCTNVNFYNRFNSSFRLRPSFQNIVLYIGQHSMFEGCNECNSVENPDYVLVNLDEDDPNVDHRVCTIPDGTPE